MNELFKWIILNVTDEVKNYVIEDSKNIKSFDFFNPILAIQNLEDFIEYSYSIASFKKSIDYEQLTTIVDISSELLKNQMNGIISNELIDFYSIVSFN